MFDVNEIVCVNGIYISQLYKDWYAVEGIVQREKNIFRVRVPYKTLADAQNVLSQIRQRQQNIKQPDYRPVVHIMNQGKVR